MDHPNQRHGNHTWDLILHYYCCPKCDYVMENRDKYQLRFHQLEKDLVCPRCQHAFKMEKKIPSTFGPFLGHDPEVDRL